MLQRLALYYVPRDGEFAARGGRWLGWDVAAGRDLRPPQLPGLPCPAEDLTADPRRYGFHATLRPPFRPGADWTLPRIQDFTAALARRLAPVRLDGLEVQTLGNFLALVPLGDTAALQALASRIIRATQPLRAPVTEEERARRRPEALTPRQRAHLETWGYPYVMEDFHFHMTLTGPLATDRAREVGPLLQEHFAAVLPRPFVIEDLCLLGEDEAGCFHLLDRFELLG